MAKAQVNGSFTLTWALAFGRCANTVSHGIEHSGGLRLADTTAGRGRAAVLPPSRMREHEQTGRCGRGGGDQRLPRCGSALRGRSASVPASLWMGSASTQRGLPVVVAERGAPIPPEPGSSGVCAAGDLRCTPWSWSVTVGRDQPGMRDQIRVIERSGDRPGHGKRDLGSALLIVRARKPQELPSSQAARHLFVFRDVIHTASAGGSGLGCWRMGPRPSRCSRRRRARCADGRRRVPAEPVSLGTSEPGVRF
jgi:hypothetical protein